MPWVCSSTRGWPGSRRIPVREPCLHHRLGRRPRQGGGRPSLRGLDPVDRVSVTYSDSKLLVTAFAAAAARRWPEVLVNSVDPGWVPTRMGGRGAPDDLSLGHVTQTWLAVSPETEARTSGGYWYHQRRQEPHPAVLDPAFHEQLLAALERLTGVAFR